MSPPLVGHIRLYSYKTGGRGLAEGDLVRRVYIRDKKEGTGLDYTPNRQKAVSYLYIVGL
jgi:hypothetical protein